MSYVPVLVLWEMAMLLKVRRIALREPYGEWAEHLLAQPGFALATVDISMLAATAHVMAWRLSVAA